MKMKYFEIARKLSFKSDYETHKLGSCVVKGNKLLGLGFNKKKTHPKSNSRFKNIHAELSAILNCQQENLYGCDIYVYRENKKGELSLSKPCNCCLEIIKQVGIRRVYFSTDRGYDSLEVS